MRLGSRFHSPFLITTKTSGFKLIAVRYLGIEGDFFRLKNKAKFCFEARSVVERFGGLFDVYLTPVNATPVNARMIKWI